MSKERLELRMQQMREAIKSVFDVEVEDLPTDLTELKEGEDVNGRTIDKVIIQPTTVYKPYGQETVRRARVSTFVKGNNEGTYIIGTREGIATIQDGFIAASSTVKPKSMVDWAIKVK